MRFLLCSLLICSWALLAAHPIPPPAEKKIGFAVRTPQAPKIDGKIDDPEWGAAEVLSNFIEFEPTNLEAASERTEVRLLYDDRALYVSANLFDSQPDNIQRQLGDRDSEDNVNADIFGIGLDTYNDDQNAFLFKVSAAGVQTDVRLSQLGYDPVWDAVWKSAVHLHDGGWSVELEIPYSALRFAKTPTQVWGLQFQRVLRRTREVFYWNPQRRDVDGEVNQWGELQGLNNIHPGLRLSLLPYISTYVEQYSPGQNSTESPRTARSFNAGADLKYGISESFTLDMTLVPDFGQVRSDNQVLNLSPFEVRFQENRPFFTEGTELFNIGGVFYSRRIGAQPRKFWSAYDSLGTDEEIVSNQGQTQLVNAFKISGRTKKKTGLGIFNAMTNRSTATISGPEGSREVTTQAFTNYNVAVIDQSISNNSFASLINTNRYEIDGYMANVTAGRIRLADNSNTWYAFASGAVSQRWEDIQDSDSLDLGYKYYYEVGKGSGNFTFRVSQNIESENYNPNDLGFLRAPNEFTDRVAFNYNIYKPFWKLAGQFNNLSFTRTNLFQPYRFSSFDANYNSWFQFKSFDFAGFSVWGNPIASHDYFEPRIPGMYLIYPRAGGVNSFVSTNYARVWALDVNAGLWKRPGFDTRGFNLSVQPRYRFSDRIQLVHETRLDNTDNGRGFVTFSDEGESLIGTRDRKDVINTTTLIYAFTPRMNLNFRVRHYWSRVTYDAIEALQEDGTLAVTEYSENEDINFNAFNVDCVFRWRFAPGSDMFIVWKNSILESGEFIVPSYTENLRSTFSSPQLNSVSLRVLYFIDFARFQKQKGEA